MASVWGSKRSEVVNVWEREDWLYYIIFFWYEFQTIAPVVICDRVIAIQRWIYNIDNWESMRKGLIPKVNPTMARFILGRFQGYVQKMVYAQGMGRHTQEEVYTIARGDLESVSNFIGKCLWYSVLFWILMSASSFQQLKPIVSAC